MKRAVVIFMEKKRDLLLQFGCLYTSFKHINAKDTDLVVFGTKDVLPLLPDDCVKLECEKASHPPELLHYPRINSIHCFTTEKAKELEKHYDIILRTDVDTFLTPAWNHYYPTTYTVGKGGYATYQIVKDHLKRVAKELGLNHRSLHNLGATHYGKTKSVIDVSTLAVTIGKHLLTKEFKTDKGKWPSWYGGVINMYSNEIAVNHLIKDVSINRRHLDFESTSSDSVMNHAHLHCWHTDHVFSKFQFTAGKYDKLETKNLNMNKIKDYCLAIALKAKRDLPEIMK